MMAILCKVRRSASDHELARVSGAVGGLGTG